jgi:hypothetical protein
MEYNEKDVRFFINQYIEIKEKVYDIFDKYRNITRRVKNSASISEIDFSENNIYISWSNYYSGDADYGTEEIPIEYLWEEDWEEKLRLEIEEERRQKEEQSKEQARISKEQQEQEERRLFEQLKMKYGEII